jgi:hypothetical protein
MGLRSVDRFLCRITILELVFAIVTRGAWRGKALHAAGVRRFILGASARADEASNGQKSLFAAARTPILVHPRAWPQI